ncbi:MAG: ComEC/Rec2 family competence protein [Chitinophagaceae bacterium]|jgi:competence protein ComEC
MAFRNYAPLWHRTPILRLLIPFVAGIIVFDSTQPISIPFSFLYTTLLITIIIFATFSFVTFRKHDAEIYQFISGQLLLLNFGFVLCSFNSAPANPYWFDHHSTQFSNTLATVSAEPLQKNKTVKYQVEIIALSDSKKTKHATGKAFVYVFKGGNASKIHIGDTLLLPNKWQKLTNSGNPFDFDFKQYCERKNIYFQQFLNADEVVIYNILKPSSQSVFNHAHLYCIQLLDATISDTTTKALLKAMLLGDEHEIDPNVRQAYSDTGIIHIISISGAHVVMLFIAISFCFRWIKKQKYAWIKFAISLSIIWFYVILAGSSTPALRAAIMFTILAAGTLLEKQSNPLNQLFVTAFLLLLLQPMWLFTIGFQLSFTAVLSLLIFYEPIASLLKPSNKIVQFLWQAITASIAAEILVAPFVAFYFHSFPPMFIIANVLASAAMGFILCLGFLLLLFGKISFVAKALGVTITVMSKAFHYCIEVLQKANWELFKTIFFSVPSLILIFVLICSFAIFIFHKNKSAIWAGMFSLLLLSILFLKNNFETVQQKKLIVFNIGGETHCELITGSTYQILSGEKEENYTTKNAHIGFCANRMKTRANQKVLVLNDQKILLIDSNTCLRKGFKTDILIVSSSKKHFDISEAIVAFSPTKIIIGNNLNKWQAKNWQDECAAANIALHYTKEDGAFIFPD